MEYSNFLLAWDRLGVAFNFPPLEKQMSHLLEDENGDRLIRFVFALPENILSDDYPEEVSITVSVLQEMAFLLAEKSNEGELFRAVRSQLQHYQKIGAYFTVDECRTLIKTFKAHDIPDLVASDIWTGIYLIIMSGYVLDHDFNFDDFAKPVFQKFNELYDLMKSEGKL